MLLSMQVSRRGAVVVRADYLGSTTNQVRSAVEEHV